MNDTVCTYEYIYIYSYVYIHIHICIIYVYTSVYLCIACMKQGGTEKKMMPIIDEHEPAFFERPFRTQATNAPRSSGRERQFSSMLWRQSKLERLPSSILRWLEGHQSSISRFRSRFEQHLSSILRLRGTLERPFRASCGAGPGSSGHFASQLRLRARLERPFREPAAAPGQARAAISSQLQLRARP